MRMTLEDLRIVTANRERIHMVDLSREETEMTLAYLHPPEEDEISIAETVRTLQEMPEAAKLHPLAIY